MSQRVTLRPGTLDDIPAAAAVRASAVTDAIITAEGMMTWVSDLPADADVFLLAAEADGQMVGWCNGWRDVFGDDRGAAMIDTIVLPEHQRHGLGTRLTTEGLRHMDAVGVLTLRASSVDGSAERAMATRFGFVATHASSTSAVDPRTVEPLPLPEGVTIKSFGEIDDPRPIFELDVEVSRDVPGEQTFDAMTFEQWKRRFFHSPIADDDTSLVVCVDGELVGMTILRVDRPTHRAQNNITGVRRSFRSRGLARLLKSHSLHRAAQAGITVAFTNNDETNAPILAINRGLGYRHSSRHIDWERRTASS